MIPCSSTGMLLEQHKEALLNLLSDPKLLEEQVNLALKTLKEYVTYFCLYNILLHVYKAIFTHSSMSLSFSK